MIVVVSLVVITFEACQNMLRSALSNFIHNSSLITSAPLIIAISFNISFFLSPNHGAFTAKTLRTHLSLFKTNVVNACPSMSSAIITTSFVHAFAICSKLGSNSSTEDIFLSVINM
jgi:hypothetical protein